MAKLFSFSQLSYLILFICGSLLSSCSKEQDSKKALNQIKLSTEIDGLIRDSTNVSPIVDSLRTQFMLLPDTEQINVLAELSENWRPYSLQLAKEAWDQSKKLNYPYGSALAECKMGIHYYRAYILDSAKLFLDRSYQNSISFGWKKITVQAIGWQGEVNRRSDQKEKAIELQKKGLAIAKTINDKKGAAFCWMAMGEAYRDIFEFDSAFTCYNQCIALSTQNNDVYKIIICNNSMGDINRVKGNYVRALEYFNTSLELAKKSGNKRPLAYCLNTVGDIYNAQKELDKSLSFYKEAIQIALEIGDKLRVSNIYNSMGTMYQQSGSSDTAIICFNRSQKIAEEIGNMDNISNAYKNKGSVYFTKNIFDSALNYFNQALVISTKTGNKGQISDIYNDIGECYFIIKDYSKAKNAAQKSMDIAKETGILDNIKTSAKLLSVIFAAQNQNTEAFKMLSLFITMKDSLSNEEQVKQFAAVEFKAKEEGLKAEQRAQEKTFKAEQARKEEELKRQKTIRYAFTVGFALVLVLVVVVFRNLQVNKKKNKIITAQKKEVEHQKELVEEKNKEITDSITYAKRLQDAILPPLKMVHTYFPESFIYYNPKDIIAGDFYWMEHVGDTTFFAAADSTGHGVPGAMVSVVCSNALNRAIKEFKLSEPGKILDKTRELVLETFEKSEGEVKDGMDISLMSIEHKKQIIQWSGANNPLWYISNNEMKEIKAHKQPIGKTDNPTPFVTHSIPFEKGSMIYLFTDGFADQFGGPKGKKFKYKPLQEILLTCSAKTMDEQHSILSKTFDEWKGHFDQVDDVTLIGVKL
jgi:tetratricopeptide (TPR) repeat protein